MYAKAIKLDPNVPAYWSNRAFANIKLENYGYAIRDATEALKIDPGFIKAYYRRASANMSLGKFKESLKDLKMVTKYAPNDPDARRKYLEGMPTIEVYLTYSLCIVEKIVRRMEFEKALSYDEVKKSIIDSLDMTTMSLDSNYTGYKFENLDEPINIDFVNDMVARFERQERIPKLHVTKVILNIVQSYNSFGS